jgi:hypothetical protein
MIGVGSFRIHNNKCTHSRTIFAWDDPDGIGEKREGARSFLLVG